MQTAQHHAATPLRKSEQGLKYEEINPSITGNLITIH